MHILVIDDEINVVETMAVYIRGNYHTCTPLSHVEGEMALRDVLSKTQPDGVIVDYGMPVEGAEVYRWIKTWNDGVKVVFYTSYANTPMKLKMLEAGASEREIVEKREIASDIGRLLAVLS
jgi:DNA-binding NarL/FixJ family response regulator